MHKIIIICDEQQLPYPIQLILQVCHRIYQTHPVSMVPIDDGICIKFNINHIVRFVWFSETTSTNRHSLEAEVLDSHTNRVIYFPVIMPLPDIEQILQKTTTAHIDVVDKSLVSPDYCTVLIGLLTRWLHMELSYPTPAPSASSVLTQPTTVPPPLHSHTSRPSFTSQSSLLLKALQEHPSLISWNSAAQSHPLAPRLVIADQHLIFICHQLHNFSNAIKIQPSTNSYSRYYTKKDWAMIPVPTNTGMPAFEITEPISWTEGINPAETRERGILFFTIAQNPGQYCVLFKSDIQIRDGQTNQSLGFMYKSGQTKVVKCHGLLFTFKYRTDSDTFQILSIQSVVTCSRFATQRLLRVRNTLFDLVSAENIQIPEDLNDLAPKSLELGLMPIFNEQQNDFINWKQICFKHGQAVDAQRTILYYQENKGQKILKDRIQNCGTFTQRIYACLTFLSAIKELLRENYLPVDLKYDNMCVQFIDTPQGKMPKLSIIDFIGFAPTFSLFKRVSHPPFIPGVHLSAALNLDEYGLLLRKLNDRTAIPDDLFGGCLVRQLMFEMIINVFNIINQQSRAGEICAHFNQYFPLNPGESWLNQAGQMGKCFTTLLNECIYTKFEPPYFDIRYWADKWIQIGEQIGSVYNKTVKIQNALPPTATIAEDPTLSALYLNLFSSEKAREWTELILNFRNTPSPFADANKKLLFLKNI